MATIFLDESGDLGFDLRKKGTSKHFVITFLFAANARVIEKAVRDVHRTLKKSHKMSGGVLHCFRQKPIVRCRLLKRLSEKNCSVMTIYLNKEKVYTKLPEEKDILYNYVTNILLDRIVTKKLIPPNDKIILIASRKETNKFINDNFKTYLETRVMSDHKLNLHIEIKTPHEAKGLQAVDFLSWAIFRKYEKGDESYYNLFKRIIAEENSLFG